jgi:hypothetical protein
MKGGGPAVPKKNKKESKPQTPARFATGAQVRVKPGTTDPDFSDIPLGGWAGTISEVDQRSAPPTYLIEWDRHTLDHLHPVYRKRCERDGLELKRMWLGEDDIEPDTGGPAVIEQPTSIVTRPLNQKDQDVGFHKKTMTLLRQSSLNDEKLNVVADRIKTLLDTATAEVKRTQQLNFTERFSLGRHPSIHEAVGLGRAFQVELLDFNQGEELSGDEALDVPVQVTAIGQAHFEPV